MENIKNYFDIIGVKRKRREVLSNGWEICNAKTQGRKVF